VIDKEKVKRLYKKGYKPKEIAECMSVDGVIVNDRAVSKCIERHCIDLKDTHEANCKERRNIQQECNRLLTKENNRYMSTRQAVIQNIQSYTTKNGKLVFDTSRGAKPFDMPRTYAYIGG